jgi:putative addiction module CopG family antidote
MATVNCKIALTPDLMGFLEQKVRQGGYDDLSEVVREAVRRMREAETARSVVEFDGLFEGGAESPPTEADIDEVVRLQKSTRKKNRA